MRDELFSYYVAFGHSLCYKREYAISTRRISNAYQGFLMLASAGGIVTLSYWKEYPLLWSIIALSAQVLQVLHPLTQAAKQRQALKYIIHDANIIFDEIGAYWNLVNLGNPPVEDDAAIGAKIEDFKQRMRDSENRFAGDLDFPFKRRLDKKAIEQNLKYFWYYYGVKPEKGDHYE